uniref:Uncharacterized protein n=1 Tax=Setaria digitata TaxID=48799 RepID=A0A915PH99_9BILA
MKFENFALLEPWREMTGQEESLTGDVDLESGIRRKHVTSSSSAVASPQVSSRTSRSVSEGRNIWEHDMSLDIPKDLDSWDSEQKKYWEYRNIYHIPVPQGIELWEDEDKKRWEMINVGGLDESEADRQIKKAKVEFMNAKHQTNRAISNAQRKDPSFVVLLLCFGVQISVAFVCIGFCALQLINNEIQAGIVFLLLSIMPFFGAVGVMGLATAAFNISSAVGIIVTAVTVNTFKVPGPHPLSAFVPLASVVAFVQIASFAMFLILHWHYLTVPPTYTIGSRRDGARSHQKKVMKSNERMERELKAKTEDVTRRYKQYLQKRKEIGERSGILSFNSSIWFGGETIQLDGPSNSVLERQIDDFIVSKEGNFDMPQSITDSRNYVTQATAIHNGVKQHQEQDDNTNETFGANENK